MTAAKKYVYKFGLNVAEGNKEMKQLLGGKGANLSEMSSIGLPVPAGFTISTEACEYYSSNKQSWPENLMDSVQEGIRHIENSMEAGFGDNRNPLLLSVRSGAAVSMPGMMDTVLDLGLNDQTVKGLARKTENEWFAFDCYRRFINMFGNVVMKIPHERFEEILELLKEDRGIELDTELETDDLKELVDRYKAIYRKETGYMFPSDPQEQLKRSINAVFESWNTPRAVTYRKINRIRDLKGTGVNVQAMVYGNMGDDCATGVCFTRNPSDGTNKMYGEFLINAQGEDVVAGIRTPQDINELSEEMPEMFEELVNICRKLEKHYENMQDIEFTIQHGKLYILQTRDGKRTGPAALKIAVDMVEDGLTSKEHAVEKLVTPNHLDQLLHPQLDMEKIDKSDILGEGLPASPGAAVGKVVFSSDDAEEAAKNGDPVILTRVETSPDDVGGMSAAEGILTSRGGMTSHAAVVARGWGKPCVAGCGDIIINYKKKSFTNGKVTVKEGDWISLDGTKGWVLKGEKPVVKPELDKYFETFMNWVDEFRDMKVRTNADTPEDASRAREFGAQGIGLCRTEHMFFGEERIRAMRKMIISDTADERKKALAGLLPYQKEDFIGIFEVMDGLPVTIRLLDPPLHEFLPEDEEEIEHVAEDLNIDKEDFIQKIKPLKEFNPMLGHRGCRLGITFPEITEMQVRAIIEAALELKSQGKIVVPEIMVPLIGTAEEFESQRNVIRKTCMSVFEEFGEDVDYKIGTMIEIPRATLVAEKIAENADFFSFGTNDLTQMTYGYSRDDAGKFLGHYIQEGILPDDPFQVLDVEGVGQLVSMAVKNGRKRKPDLKVGICGEHGGEPNSVRFFYNEKLNYVSCSPFRVPVARLSAAQAQLLDR